MQSRAAATRIDRESAANCGTRWVQSRTDPCKRKFLTTDLDGEAFNEDWEHGSAVGMLKVLLGEHKARHAIRRPSVWKIFAQPGSKPRQGCQEDLSMLGKQNKEMRETMSNKNHCRLRHQCMRLNRNAQTYDTTTGKDVSSR